jgi:hypothetical protein
VDHRQNGAEFPPFGAGGRKGIAFPDIENEAHPVAPAQDVDLVRRERIDSRRAGNDDADPFQAEASDRSEGRDRASSADTASVYPSFRCMSIAG